MGFYYIILNFKYQKKIKHGNVNPKDWKKSAEKDAHGVYSSPYIKHRQTKDEAYQRDEEAKHHRFTHEQSGIPHKREKKHYCKQYTALVYVCFVGRALAFAHKLVYHDSEIKSAKEKGKRGEKTK